MKFAAQSWLWFLLALPLVYFVLMFDENRRKKRFARFAREATWKSIAPETDHSSGMAKARIWLLAMGFAILAMARPQWGSHEEIAHVTGMDIFFLLDVSNSMEVEDTTPSRLKKAKHLIKSIVDRLHGDRAGVVAFAASSYLACPLTTDLDYVLEVIDLLTPKIVSSQGTDLGLGLETVRKALERGAEDSPAGAGDALLSKAVILISDGEDQEGQVAETAKKLRDSGARLYIFGVGTQKGGPIPIRDESGNLQGYKKDRKGQPIVSTFRPDSLLQLANDVGGRYWNATPDESEIEELLQDMSGMSRSDYAERRFLVFEDRYQFPLALAVLLLLLEMTIPNWKKSTSRLLRMERGPKRGESSGRAGLLLIFAAVSALHLFRPSAAWALPHSVPLDTYFENRKGLDAFREGKMDEAKRHFGAAQALDPGLQELQFNQGVIQMQEGNVEGAIQSFDAANRPASDGRLPDSKLLGKSLYNLGGALTKKGDIPGAIRSYSGAIASAKAEGDEALEKDARKNLELLIQERQKQKQQNKKKEDEQKQDQKEQQKQEQQKQEKQQQEQKKQEEQKQDTDNKEQDSQEKQNQQKEYKETRKQKFKSVKLSDEDAERVMAELKNRERELQRRLKKQNANPQGTQKDW